MLRRLTGFIRHHSSSGTPFWRSNWKARIHGVASYLLLEIKKYLYHATVRVFDVGRKRKILGIWDFAEQGYSTIGDHVSYLEILNCLRSRYGLAKGDVDGSIVNNVDLCYVDDGREIARKNRIYKSHMLTKSSAWKRMIMDTHVLLPSVAQVRYFKNRADFDRFRRANKSKYISYPTPNGKGTAATIRIIFRFYSDFGFIPLLRSPQDQLARARSFVAKHSRGRIPIVVGLRRNTGHQVSRNTNIDELAKFFRHYERENKYVFIVICSKSEIVGDLRKFKNVIYSKDYFSTIQEDIALIQVARACIFPDTGTANVAWYCQVPAIHYGYVVNWGVFRATQINERPNYFAPFQRLYWQDLKADWLLREFEKLMNSLESSRKRPSVRAGEWKIA